MRRRALLSALVAVCSCSKKKEGEGPAFDYGEPKKSYSMQGEILRLRPENRIAVVKHEKIGDWMEAMTMEFPVPDAREYSKLKEGMKIRATVQTNDSYFWLTEIRPQ